MKDPTRLRYVMKRGSSRLSRYSSQPPQKSITKELTKLNRPLHQLSFSGFRLEDMVEIPWESDADSRIKTQVINIIYAIYRPIHPFPW